MDHRSLIFQAGVSTWPAISVPEATFFEHLRVCMNGADRDEALSQVRHGADLYLACACCHDLPQALQTFEKHFMSKVPQYLARYPMGKDQIDEIQQQLREKLFLKTTRRPRIAAYSGRGTLATWLRTIATRAALDLLPADAEPRASVSEVLAGPAPDPELGHLRKALVGPFREALRQAIGQLGPVQRNLLRLYYEEGLTTTQVGALLGVTHSAVVKQLGALREALYQETRRRLRARLHITDQEFVSLVRLVRSHLDDHLTDVLKAS